MCRHSRRHSPTRPRRRECARTRSPWSRRRARAPGATRYRPEGSHAWDGRVTRRGALTPTRSILRPCHSLAIHQDLDFVPHGREDFSIQGFSCPATTVRNEDHIWYPGGLPWSIRRHPSVRVLRRDHGVAVRSLREPPDDRRRSQGQGHAEDSCALRSGLDHALGARTSKQRRTETKRMRRLRDGT